MDDSSNPIVAPAKEGDGTKTPVRAPQSPFFGVKSGHRTVAATELDWRVGDDEFTLHYRHRRLLSVVPDATYPGMWRINRRGRLSDMVNLARAKDAALSWALADLNKTTNQTTKTGDEFL